MPNGPFNPGDIPDDDRTLRAHTAAKSLIAYYELRVDSDVTRAWYVVIMDALLGNDLESVDWRALARHDQPPKK